MRTAFALLALLAVSGCVVQTDPCPSVPSPPDEVRPKPPVSEIPPTWQPGHVDWDGRTYAMVPGRWLTRPVANPTWMPGHWERGEGVSCRWVPAHWL